VDPVLKLQRSPVSRQDRCIAVGWDLHRLEEGKRLVIGGVDVPHTKGTIAHSDGGSLLPLA
jgi:2C-methyl-D-erythritol 2,4-cyclodiphosphate synthase